MGKERKPFPPWQSSRKDDRLNILNYADPFRSISLFKRHAKILVSFVYAAAKGRDDTFFLTFSTACNDGLYKVKSESTFRRDMAKLQKVGLIRCISNGKNRRIKSVYQMSSEWQAYKLENTLAK